jgi:hypothetical protein
VRAPLSQRRWARPAERSAASNSPSPRATASKDLDPLLPIDPIAEVDTKAIAVALNRARADLHAVHETKIVDAKRRCLLGRPSLDDHVPITTGDVSTTGAQEPLSLPRVRHVHQSTREHHTAERFVERETLDRRLDHLRAVDAAHRRTLVRGQHAPAARDQCVRDTTDAAPELKDGGARRDGVVDDASSPRRRSRGYMATGEPVGGDVVDHPPSYPFRHPCAESARSRAARRDQRTCVCASANWDDEGARCAHHRRMAGEPTLARQACKCVDLGDGCHAVCFAALPIELGIVIEDARIERAVWLLVNEAGDPVFLAEATTATA